MIAYAIADRVPELFESVFILILIIRGFLFITIPYFSITEKELIIFNRFGTSHKTYKFSHLSDFQIERNKLYVKQSGKVKKVRVSRIFIQPKRWDELMALMKAKDLTKELH